MGMSLRNPGQLIALLCQSASVAAGAVLVQGTANDSVKLPSGANSREAFIGVAYQAGLASSTQPISVILNGVFACTASGSITAGDRLVIGGALGTVASESASTPVDATRIGQALETVTDGQSVAVLIGADQPPFSGTVIKLTAGGSILANSQVIAAGASTVVATAGASPTAAIVGVALNAASASESVYVVTSGRAIVTCGAGAGVTANDFITSAGATGLGLTAAPAGGTNCAVVGIALATTSASGSIPVSVCPGRIQG